MPWGGFADALAEKNGLTVTNTAIVWSVFSTYDIAWSRSINPRTGSRYDHTGLVTAVHDDGTIDVLHTWSGIGMHMWERRVVPGDMKFVYVGPPSGQIEYGG